MNNHIDTYLTNVLKTNKLSHAYLFISEDLSLIEEYVGKFVKSIFCLNKDNSPFFCDNCKICKQINNGSYVDYYILDSDSTIKKEDIIKLKNELTIRAKHTKKVYWLKNIDNITAQAANSLLKILEEPEDDIIAILSTSNVSSVLNTIVSRCQLLRLNSNNINNIEKTDEYFIVEKLFSQYLNNIKKNNYMATLNLIEELKDKESIILFFNYLLYKVKNINYLNYPISKNIESFYEQLLKSLSSIEKNVSATLVLENFLFYIILKNINIDFLEKT